MSNYNRSRKIISRKILYTAFFCFFYFVSISQSLSGEGIIKNINLVTDNSQLSNSKKLNLLYLLKQKTDKSNLIKDSGYARLLSKIGLYEYFVNKNYDSSIKLTLQAVEINKINKKNSSKIDLINSYNNLGYYFKDILLLHKALNYHDSAILTAQNFAPADALVVDAKLDNVYIYFLLGDYQKCIEESTKGLALPVIDNDSSYYINFLNQRSQSFLFINNLQEALTDAEIVIGRSSGLKYSFLLATAFKTKALVLEKQKNFSSAELFYKKCIETRIITHANGQIASDYNDLGNFYLNSLKKIKDAKSSYYKSIDYAQKDNDISRLAAAHINLGEANFAEQNYKETEKLYVKAFNDLRISNNNILNNPPAVQLNLIGNKDRITVLLMNKIDLLLRLYKNSGDQKYINAVVDLALITDSVVTQARHEQYREQSKLYWRNKTRLFFINALEACYLSNDVKHALYFMEKSRSALLNDKLNELAALSNLNITFTNQEQELQVRLVTEQQKLNTLEPSTPEYNKQQLKLFNLKTEFEHFIKSLETKYPAYYKYKYDDEVPALDSLQTYLGKSHQSFVHYFTNDTVAYILSITAGNAKILKLTSKDFNQQQINGFANFCSNKDSLNSYYGAFATLSNTLYKILFQPLQLPKGGRVIICSDNFLIPFEALCSDVNGKDFLIHNYTFSYAYSATYLLKRFADFPGKGNFVGFAPVSFQKYLDVPDLKNSATALAKSANEYSNDLLFVNAEATKNNFLQHIGSYTIANVLSHASADSSETEPRLYMQDSTINLSELQLLDNKPATKLVVLSACQTNVGKNATGEGIYSLARGFTTAGIPSIAATLWNADEDMIYEISAGFHKYLSQGMSKDSALQKAKIDFIKNNDKEKELPYYWANMILIGNTEPLQLTSSNIGWWWVTGATVIILAIVTLVAIRKRRQRNAP